ncbi:MAG: hypothetical protein KatS3mg035_1281 [Bacteroidia bacterium]|nr:MAG: hypothetical protein KatS3mg035_1281 [Bacteroidia bacterium]
MAKLEVIPDNQIITTGAFPKSEKIYVKGKLYPIQVAMRQIHLSQGELPIIVYDTSGPYTDNNQTIDIYKGLNKIRKSWILDRNDVEELEEVSSHYGKERLLKRELDAIRFPHVPKPLRAKKGHNVTQLHYARKGIITPEMEICCYKRKSMFGTV